MTDDPTTKHYYTVTVRKDGQRVAQASLVGPLHGVRLWAAEARRQNPGAWTEIRYEPDPRFGSK